MKKIAAILLIVTLTITMFGCGGKNDTASNKVVVLSSCEEYRNEVYLKALKEKFPNYDISIEYYPSGNHAAKLIAEGKNAACDISIEIEYGYIEKLKDVFADLSAYDHTIYAEDALSVSPNVLPVTKNGGCIAINKEVLDKKGVAVPTSYEDLLKPEYKGLISMPNPKSSGTGYMFVKSLVNAWGEDKAFEYFDKLAQNVKFTTSGSGPVNDLVQGEAGIGLAITSQTVTEINKGVKLEMKFFKEGSPYSLYGIAMIDGKQKNKAVKEVFDYFVSDLIPKDKATYFPEKIYKDKDFTVENFPKDIKYSDMKNNTNSEKERLLSKWKY